MHCTPVSRALCLSVCLTTCLSPHPLSLRLSPRLYAPSPCSRSRTDSWRSTLPVCLSVYPLVCLSTCLPTCLSTCLPTWLPVPTCDHQSSVCVCVRPHVCLPTCLCPPACPINHPVAQVTKYFRNNLSTGSRDVAYFLPHPKQKDRKRNVVVAQIILDTNKKLLTIAVIQKAWTDGRFRCNLLLFSYKFNAYLSDLMQKLCINRDQ